MIKTHQLKYQNTFPSSKQKNPLPTKSFKCYQTFTEVFECDAFKQFSI